VVVLEGIGETAGGHSSSRVKAFRRKSSVVSRRAERRRARMSAAVLLGAHARTRQCGSLCSSCRTASTTVTVLPVPGLWGRERTEGRGGGESGKEDARAVDDEGHAARRLEDDGEDGLQLPGVVADVVVVELKFSSWLWVSTGGSRMWRVLGKSRRSGLWARRWRAACGAWECG